MCYKFAQEEEEITRPCKHIFSFKCDFHKASFSMWDFLPSLRLRIFSALVGDFSETLKEKLARVQKKEKRLRYFLRKISGEEKLKMSDGRSTPGSGISVRIWSGWPWEKSTKFQKSIVLAFNNDHDIFVKTGKSVTKSHLKCDAESGKERG